MNSTLRLYASNVAFKPSAENVQFIGASISGQHSFSGGSLHFQSSRQQRTQLKNLLLFYIMESLFQLISVFFSSLSLEPDQTSRFHFESHRLLCGDFCNLAVFLGNPSSWLAFRKAAESLKKLMDVTREELPSTMAAIRFSGMEISDLTMELSDLGQEITQRS